MATGSRIEHDDHVEQQSHGGLTTPSISLWDFIFQTFSIIDFIDFIASTIKNITINLYN